MESAVMTALRVDRKKRIAAGEEETPAGEFDPADSQWSHMEMLTADIVDELRSLARMYVITHSKKGAKVKPVVRIMRPGIAKPVSDNRLSHEQRMWLDPRMRKGYVRNGREIQRRLARD